MTQDFLNDFCDVLEKERKYYVISIFEENLAGLHVRTNLDSIKEDIEYPDGHKESPRVMASRGIKFALTGEN